MPIPTLKKERHAFILKPLEEVCRGKARRVGEGRVERGHRIAYVGLELLGRDVVLVAGKGAGAAMRHAACILLHGVSL